jgi:predicted flavoprotein YhiN
VVDVTGELGGYNFQWAFSSGMICAENMAEWIYIYIYVIIKYKKL